MSADHRNLSRPRRPRAGRSVESLDGFRYMAAPIVKISFALVCLMAVPAAAELPKFETLTIDANADKVVYAVTVADVNNDKKPDIVAVTNRAVYWYAAPDWKKHTIIADQTEPDNVCIAAHDIDRDGSVDFALGAGWTKKGTVQWLSRGDSLNEPWNVHQIAVEPWLHRMRFADVLGTGEPQLVISPLNKAKRKGVRLTAFSIPKNARADRWVPTVLDETMDRMHNHWHVDIDGDKQVDTVTASVEGIHWLRKTDDGWEKARIGSGSNGKTKGAGEVKFGQRADGNMFCATVEPMHGNSVATYTRVGNQWRKQVLMDGFKRGHAIWVTNLDDDLDDEIIFGFSDPRPDRKVAGRVINPGVYVFDRVPGKREAWEFIPIDNGGVATEDIVAADLNGDGKTDIVAGGRATHNVRLYISK